MSVRPHARPLPQRIDLEFSRLAVSGQVLDDTEVLRGSRGVEDGEALYLVTLQSITVAYETSGMHTPKQHVRIPVPCTVADLLRKLDVGAAAGAQTTPARPRAALLARTDADFRTDADALERALVTQGSHGIVAERAAVLYCGRKLDNDTQLTAEVDELFIAEEWDTTSEDERYLAELRFMGGRRTMLSLPLSWTWRQVKEHVLPVRLRPTRSVHRRALTHARCCRAPTPSTSSFCTAASGWTMMMSCVVRTLSRTGT